MRKGQREEWVDRVRGLCMMAILLFHTENYYAGEEIIPYALYVDNVLIAFFFISGYLIHRNGTPFSYQKKMSAIVRSILLPYFIFTTIIAIPKVLIREETTFSETVWGILTGHASWFVAALAVAEILFASMLHLFKERICPLAVTSCVSFFLVALAYHFIDNDLLEQHNYWCFQNALLMLPFIFMGYAFRRNNKWQEWFNRRRNILFFVYLLAIIKGIVHAEGMTLTLQPIHVSTFLILLVDGLTGTVLLIALCKWMSSKRLMQYIGKHSIIYYFICGGVPFLVTRALTRVGFPYENLYLLIILAFILVVLITTGITYLICSFPQKVWKNRG